MPKSEADLLQEMFVQHLAKQAHNVAKSERKPRRNIAYNHLGTLNFDPSLIFKLIKHKATVVARVDNLQFLSDVIPRTIPYNQYKEKASKGAKKGDAITPGQTTLDESHVSDEGSDPKTDVEDAEVPGPEDPNISPVRTHNLEVRVRGERSNGVTGVEENAEQKNGLNNGQKDVTME